MSLKISVFLVAVLAAATAATGATSPGTRFASNAEFLEACQGGGDGRRLCLEYMHEAVKSTLSLAKDSGWTADTFCPPPVNDAKLIEIIVNYLKTDPRTPYLSPDAAAQIAFLGASKCIGKSR
ncbi:MAG TPA: hypothetical protein VET85_13575 [Stellaceae bacterium]|nr:hypothetical protein [Stellaceae bacterium]